MASISITAPSSAKKGVVVSVSVKVTNTLAYHASFKATIYAVPDRYPDYVIGSIDQVILSGSSVTRSASFTMPDCNTTVFVWVERWATDHWVYDGSASKVVSLEIPVPTTFHLSILVPSWAAGGYVEPGSGDYPANTTITLRAYPLSGYKFTSWGGDASGTSTTYNLYMNSDKNVEAYFEPVPVPLQGTIIKKELEYNESRGIIPVAGVLQNKRGLFHVTARNDMSTSQPIGIYWFINDPDGLIAEEYTDWKFGTLGAGQTHEFIGGRFTFSKVGKYGTWVDLLMGSKDNPVVIYSARYIGELCTVITAVPVYKGSIAKKELEYDSVRGTIPVY